MTLPEFALSINQPWGWLVANNFKDIENRNWNTTFRGEFLIHVGKTVDRDAVVSVLAGHHPVTDSPLSTAVTLAALGASFETGGMIGIAELYGVVTKHKGYDVPFTGEHCEWFVGKYGFMLRNARPIDFIPCVGALGFFTPDYSLTYKPKPEPSPRARKAPPAPAEPEPVQAGLFDG